MLQGSPLLATWTADGSLRLYEFASNQFVPLGVASGLLHDPTNSPAQATLGWAGSTPLIVHRAEDGVFARAFDLFGDQVDSQSYGVYAAQYQSAASRDDGQLGVWEDDTGNTLFFNGAEFVNKTGAFVVSRFGKRALAFTPDAARAALVYTGGGNSTLLVLNTNSAGPPYGYSAGGVATLGVENYNMAQLSPDGRHILVGTAGASSVRVFAVSPDGSTLTELPAITLTKPLHALSVAPYGRFVAVSTLLTGAYETKIYRRIGDFYREIQTVAGLGGMLDFNGNGEMLVDAGLRKAYLFDPADRLFEEIPNALSGVTIGATAQAVSPHVPEVYTSAKFYQAGLARLAAQALDTENMKLTLLTDAAPAFDPTHDTFAEAAGASEAGSGGWPGGGVLLTDFAVTLVETTMAAWSFSDVEHRVISDGPLTFRTALIYDGSSPSQVPFMRIDFAEDVSVALDYILKMVFSGGKLVTFAN